MFTFKKTERLKSKKAIELLYTKGRQKSFFPLKVFVHKNQSPGPHPVRFMVSVPKKKIRSAVKRNRVKRLIREAWRLNKHLLYEEMRKKNLSADVMFLYLSGESPELRQLVKKLPAVFSFILLEITKD